MNCTEIREKLVEYIEGLLPDEQKQQLESHLKNCRLCQAEMDKLTALGNRIASDAKSKQSANFESVVFNRIIREQNLRLKQAGGVNRPLEIVRIVMKNRITKLAVAAIIVIAAIIGIYFNVSPFKTNVTFADVIKPIMNARTIIFDGFMGKDENGPVMHDIVSDNKVRRTISNMDAVMIIDLDKAKMLVLNEKKKTAVNLDIKGPLQEEHKSFIQIIRQIITDLNDMSVERLGHRNLNGFDAVGFQSKRQNGGITIWADPQTAKPIRIELQFGPVSAVLKNIEFDVPVDESLFSMDVPVGYTLKKTEVNMNEFTEQDFIESLRIWSEYVLNGNFPENISIEDYLKATPLMGEKIHQSNISKEDGTKLGMTFGKGMVFFQRLAPNGIDYRYAGRGVKLGDADKPIFWYRPRDAQNYRVIYGDLSVKEVSPENLPK
ncbi:MAG: zf-HC2 domain-containing protein [Sedimentisphaerales bacterium]